MKPKVSGKIRRQFAEMDRLLRESPSQFEQRLVRFSEEQGKHLTALYGKPRQRRGDTSLEWRSHANDLIEVIQATITLLRRRRADVTKEEARRVRELWDCALRIIVQAAEARDGDLFREVGDRIDASPAGSPLCPEADPVNARIAAKLESWERAGQLGEPVNVAEIHERLSREGIRASYQTVRRWLKDRLGVRVLPRGNPNLKTCRKK